MSSQIEFTSTSRNSWCDCIRGYAILIVCIAHSFYIEPLHDRWRFLSVYFKGDTGVFLFYVLSGFLVCGILANEVASTTSFQSRRRAIANFFGRRILRLQPSYLLFLGCYALFGSHRDGLAWWILILPISQWFRGEYITWHIKTLHIEEFFYLVTGVWTTFKRSSIEFLLWALFFLTPVFRVVLFLFHKREAPWAIWLWDHYMPFEAFAGGGLMAIHLRRVQGSKIGAIIARSPELTFILSLLALLLSSALRDVRPFSYALILTWPIVFTACSAAIILSGLAREHFLFSSEWLRKLGLMSYTVYLFQQFPLGPWEDSFGTHFQWTRWAGALLICIVSIPIWYRYVERPLTAYGAKRFPRLAKGPNAG